MTEPRGRHARWTAAALLAPASAAVFAGTMSWTTSRSPAAQAATTAGSSDPAPTATADSRDAELAHRTAQVAALRKQVAGLRKQLAAARTAHGTVPGATATTAPGGTSGGTTRRSTSTSTSTSKATTTATTKPKATTTTEATTAPATTTTTTKAPAPATSTTTGAS